MERVERKVVRLMGRIQLWSNKNQRASEKESAQSGAKVETHQVNFAISRDRALSDTASNLNLDLLRSSRSGCLERVVDNPRQARGVALVVERLEEELEGRREEGEEDEDRAKSRSPSSVQVASSCKTTSE